MPQDEPRVEEVKQFPAVERRRNPAVSGEQREAGEVAVFQELGKALTSSLQLDQVSPHHHGENRRVSAARTTGRCCCWMKPSKNSISSWPWARPRRR